MNIFITLVNYLKINTIPLHATFVLKQYSNFVNPVIASSPLFNIPRALIKNGGNDFQVALAVLEDLSETPTSWVVVCLILRDK